MNDINISKRYKTNPFIENLNIETGSKRIVVSPLGKGSNILINQETGEQQGTEVTTYKKVDNQEFVKIFVNNIALTFELHSYGIKAFNVVMWAMQYSGINKDLIVLDSYTLEGFLDKNCLKMSIPTFRRGLNELVQAKIIAKSLRKGWYFINPNFIFNGDRIAFTTLIERDREQEIPLVSLNNQHRKIESQSLDETTKKLQIKDLMVRKYNIPENKANNLLSNHPIEVIQAVIKKIEELKRKNSHVVDPRSKIPGYMIYCIENHLTEIN